MPGICWVFNKYLLNECTPLPRLTPSSGSLWPMADLDVMTTLRCPQGGNTGAQAWAKEGPIPTCQSFGVLSTPGKSAPTPSAYSSEERHVLPRLENTVCPRDPPQEEYKGFLCWETVKYPIPRLPPHTSHRDLTRLMLTLTSVCA